MKRTFSILLAIMMLMLTCIPVFAAEVNPGKIVINSPTAGQEYTVYKMVELESYDDAQGLYNYVITDDKWLAFFSKEENLAGNWYTIENGKYIITKENLSENNSTLREFAKKAIAYAEATEGITGITMTPNEGDTVLEFTNLELGYYAISSTLGTLCGLTTTNPTGTIVAKNHEPSIEKWVKEDASQTWVEIENDADLFQTIEFYADVYAKSGAQNYVVHDKMSAGLTLIEDSFVVYTTEDKSAGLVDASNYTVLINDGTHANVFTGDCADCTFHVSFTQAYCDTLEDNNEVFVFYNAFLNENAVIGVEGNPNTVYLSYGEKNYTTTEDTTVTRTYSVDIVKHTGGTLLAGAEFGLYRNSACTDADLIKLVAVEGQTNTYRIAKPEEADTALSKFTTPEGIVKIIGLDGSNIKYYLKELKAPAGYNQLLNAVEFTVIDKNLDAKLTDNKYVVANGDAPGSGGVGINNKAGTILPSTGGTGTTIFITAGVIMVIFAGIFLITKMRMRKITD